jgi:radical SAM superfamily enzyme YgiQ (UPF0313 family)
MKLRDWVDFYKSEKRKIEKKIFAPKVFFFYFHPSFLFTHYTPLDIGYLMAEVKKKADSQDSAFNEFNFQTVPVYFTPQYSEKKIDEFKEIERITKLIAKEQPVAIFFFLDNILWSGFWGIGKAVEIAKIIKQQDGMKDVFIGFQTHKITKETVCKVFRLGFIDCLVGKDPAQAFSEMKKIIEKERVRNVYYDFRPNEFVEKRVILQKSLFDSKCLPDKQRNFIDEKNPSPYLNGLMDNFLFSAKKRKSFACFLYSSFGCIFGCYYCFRSVKFENLQLFSPKRFFDEIEYLVTKFDFYNFFILDDCFAISKERLESLLVEFDLRKAGNKRLKKIKLVVMSRIEALSNLEKIILLKKLNVVKIQIGLQTTNPKLDVYMRREKGTVQKLESIKKWLEQEQILFSLDIIAGLPRDDLKNFKQTLDFAIKLNPSFIQVKRLYLSPNTFFYFRQKEFSLVAEDFLSKKFATPLVVAGEGIDEGYFKKVYAYSLKTAMTNPEIGFKLLFKEDTFFRQDKETRQILEKQYFKR